MTITINGSTHSITPPITGAALYQLAADPQGVVPDGLVVKLDGAVIPNDDCVVPVTQGMELVTQ